MAHDSRLRGPSYKTDPQVPVYSQDAASEDTIYIVVIKKHDEYNPSIGFFHHRKRETGFLAYAKFTSEIRTMRLERRLTDYFAVFDFVKIADLPYSGKCGGLYCPAEAESMVVEWDGWICDVLLRLDRHRREGRLMWRHSRGDIDILGKLRVYAPKGFVLLTSLSVFSRI